MIDPAETPAEANRRRLINLGELIALGALFISGLGLWNSWRNNGSSPAPVERKEKDQPRTIALVLRGHVEADGKVVVISPVEPGHALDSLELGTGAKSVSVGSDGRLAAADVQTLLGEPNEKKDGAIIVTITTRYIDAGTDRHATGRYRLAYRWEGGGLFGGRDLRLTSFRRG